MTSLEYLNARAADIRSAAPIAGDSATNDECIHRDALVLEVLDALGVPTLTARHPRRSVGVSDPARAWHTATTAAGRTVGMWADTVEEAALNIAVWHADDLVECFRDESCEQYHARRSGRGDVALFDLEALA